MKTEFCPRCGKPLIIKQEEDIWIGRCICGFVKNINPIVYSEKTTKKVKKGEGILDNKKEKSGFPHQCKKCGHEMADVHDLGAQYSDETNIYLFRCKKCGYTERQSDGTGN